MKTRKRLKYAKNTRKSIRKTQYAGMYNRICDLNDNIPELFPIHLQDNDNGVITQDTQGTQAQLLHLNCCWMNSALYAFLAHEQVYNILEQRDYDSFELQKNEDGDDYSLYDLANTIKEFRDFGDTPPNTATRWDAYSYYELYKLIKAKYNFMPQDFPKFGEFGDVRVIFELFLNLFERRSVPNLRHANIQRGWEKLFGEHGYVNTLPELCEFLNKNEGYTCVSFTKTWKCITEVEAVSEDEEFDAFHFVAYARITKNKWRFFDSGNTEKDVSLEETILPHCSKGKAYYISGLFIKNNILEESNIPKQEESNIPKQEEGNIPKQEESNIPKQNEEDELLQRALALSLIENQNESEEMRLARLAAEDNTLQLGDSDELATVKSDDDQTSGEGDGQKEYAEGEQLYMTGKYEEAIPILRKALILYFKDSISHNPPILEKDIQFIEGNLQKMETSLKHMKEKTVKEQITQNKEDAEAEELRLAQEKEKTEADLDTKNKELELAKKKADEERSISEEFEKIIIQNEKTQKDSEQQLKILQEKEKERIQDEQVEVERKAIQKQQELEAKEKETKKMLLLAKQAEQKRIQDEQAEAERKAIQKQQELETKQEEATNMLLLAQQAEQKRIQDEKAEAERKAIQKQQELETKQEEAKNMLILAQQAEQKRIQDEQAEAERKAIQKQQELETKQEETKNMLLLAQQAEQKRIQDEHVENKNVKTEKQDEIRTTLSKLEQAKKDAREDINNRINKMIKYNHEILVPASEKNFKDNEQYYAIWRKYWKQKSEVGPEKAWNEVYDAISLLIVEYPEETLAVEWMQKYLAEIEQDLKDADENTTQYENLLRLKYDIRTHLEKSMSLKSTTIQQEEPTQGGEIESVYTEHQDQKLQNNREQHATDSLIQSIAKNNNNKIEENNKRKTQKKNLLLLQNQIENIKPKQNILQKKIIDPVKKLKTLKLVQNEPIIEQSTGNESSERWIKRNNQWVRGIETSEEKYLREKQAEKNRDRKEKETEIQQLELQQRNENEMKDQLEHERLYKERESQKTAEKEAKKIEIIRNRKLQSLDATDSLGITNLASNELDEGEEIMYRRADGEKVMAVIKKIHNDDILLYYTIQFQDGTERQTIRDKIEQIIY